jgi:hypothetical protein
MVFFSRFSHMLGEYSKLGHEHTLSHYFQFVHYQQFCRHCVIRFTGNIIKQTTNKLTFIFHSLLFSYFIVFCILFYLLFLYFLYLLRILYFTSLPVYSPGPFKGHRFPISTKVPIGSSLASVLVRRSVYH